MTKTLKINKPAASDSANTRKPVRGRNRNNHVAPTPAPAAKPRGANSSKPQRSSDDKPRRDFGDRPPRRDYDKPRDSADRPRRDFSDKPKRDFGDRAPRRDASDKPRRDFDDRPPRRDGDKPRDFSDRPRRDFGDKPRDAPDRPRRDFNDKPKHELGDRPPRRDVEKPSTPYGKPRDTSDRPRRDFGDKPKRNFGDRPARHDDTQPANPYGKPASPYGRPRAASANSRPARSFDDQPRKMSESADRNVNPYGKKPNSTGKNFQEPRRHGKMRDENGRVIKEVAPRLAPLDAGIRLSKQLADQGICSRREADEFIEKGWVTVNGERATLGQRVLPTDRVQVARQAERAQESRVTILINKPVGYVSGQAEDGYSPAVSLVTPDNHWLEDTSENLFENKHLRSLAPAGRLDIDSVGLLVLTQDGRVAKALIGDKSEIDKEYLVRVEGTLSADGLALLNHGLELDGVPLRPAKVNWQNEDQLRFVLREGKKRQIRRMCELVGLHVVGLKRIRIGQVLLGDLPTGQWRYLRDDESF